MMKHKLQASINKFLSRPNYFPLRRFFWKAWYNLFASRYGDDINIFFMNYGYTNLDSEAKQLEINLANEEEQYCIQLYHHVANAISLKELDVLEVGCGRGGGSSYIKHYLKTKSMTGMDFSEKNIDLCHRNHSGTQLKFIVGDAEFIVFDGCSFDAVVNIESSHCYGSEERFFAEVFRVLRPQGYFLFADFRPKEAIRITNERLKSLGFKIVKNEDISANVLKSMDLEMERKTTIIQKKIPRYLQGISKGFVGVQGSPIYEAFKNGELKYFCYVLQKQPFYMASLV